MTHIDTLLRAADPAAETPDFTDAERRAILTGATAEQKIPERRGWRIGAVAAATLLVVGIGAGSLGGSGATARADEALSRAAINAADPATRPGQYWEITSTGHTRAGISFQEPGQLEAVSVDCAASQVRTEYVSVDGSQPDWYVDASVFDTGPGVPEPCRQLAEISPETAPWTTDLSSNEYRSESWQVPSPAFLASLPRDVDQLRERLYRDSAGRGRGSDAEAFVYVADVLRSGIVPADLRAALFEVLRTVDGVTVLDEPSIDGRQVVVIGIEDAVEVSQLSIDPDGGQVVGERTIDADGQVASDLLITRALVDEIPAEIQRTAERKTCTVHADGAVECSVK